MKIFGLLHFEGTHEKKAEELSKLLDNETGATFETLCSLASYKLFEVAAQTDEVEEFYSESKLKQLKENVPRLQQIFNQDAG